MNKITNKIIFVTLGVLLIAVTGIMISFKMYVKNNALVSTEKTPLVVKDARLFVLNYSGFSQIVVENIKSVEILRENEYSVRVIRPENIDVDIEQDGTKLEFFVASAHADQVKIEIGMPLLEYLECDGKSDVELRDFKLDRLAVDLDDKSDLTLSDCMINKLSLQAGGLFKANLKDADINNLELKCDGFGNLILDLDNTDVTGKLSGAIDVEIYGRGNLDKVEKDGMIHDEHMN